MSRARVRQRIEFVWIDVRASETDRRKKQATTKSIFENRSATLGWVWNRWGANEGMIDGVCRESSGWSRREFKAAAKTGLPWNITSTDVWCRVWGEVLIDWIFMCFRAKIETEILKLWLNLWLKLQLELKCLLSSQHTPKVLLANLFRTVPRWTRAHREEASTSAMPVKP